MAKKRSATRSTQAMPRNDVSLKAIRLFDTNASQKISASHALTTLNVNAACEVSSPVQNGTQYEIRILVGSILTWTSENVDDSEVIAKCRYEAMFVADHILSTPETNTLRDMAIRICWPYNRAFLSTIVTQMGLPGIMLPLLLVDAKHQMHFVSMPGMEKSNA